MTGKQVLLNGMEFSSKLMKMVVEDLTDADLLVRPVPGANHIAWQWGHLISAEHRVMSGLGFAMPPLPDGFLKYHSKPGAASDSADHFQTKAEYIRLYAEQRAASRKYLEEMDDTRLAETLPEGKFPPLFNTVCDIFYMLGAHMAFHAGQFSATRRKLGKPVAF